MPSTVDRIVYYFILFSHKQTHEEYYEDPISCIGNPVRAHVDRSEGKELCVGGN